MLMECGGSRAAAAPHFMQCSSLAATAAVAACMAEWSEGQAAASQPRASSQGHPPTLLRRRRRRTRGAARRRGLGVLGVGKQTRPWVESQGARASWQACILQAARHNKARVRWSQKAGRGGGCFDWGRCSTTSIPLCYRSAVAVRAAACYQTCQVCAQRVEFMCLTKPDNATRNTVKGQASPS